MKANELRIGNWVGIKETALHADGCNTKTTFFEIEEIKKDVVHFKCFHAGEHYRDLEPIPLTEEWLVRFGGQRLPFKTILNSIIFLIGRNRILSCGAIGTPNEMIWICEVNKENPKKIDDLVCIHNYDYDGFIPVHRFQNLFHALKGEELQAKTDMK